MDQEPGPKVLALVPRGIVSQEDPQSLSRSEDVGLMVQALKDLILRIEDGQIRVFVYATANTDETMSFKEMSRDGDAVSACQVVGLIELLRAWYIGTSFQDL